MRVSTESSDTELWPLARSNGISRRKYLQMLAFGGAAAVITACTGNAPAPTQTPQSVIFKDPTPFIKRKNGLETRLENLQEFITPTQQFFVRNNSTSLNLNAASWRLTIQGDAVTNPMVLSYRDILTLPQTTVVAYLECAGNQRAMFDILNNQRAAGTQWERGAISNGEWTGVSLGRLLELAGVERAHSVLLIGLDRDSPEGGFGRVLPIEKAVDPTTLLAYRLNGSRLPTDHGFPLRAVVPGWIGSSWIKWVGNILVSRKPLWTRNNTTSYVLIGEDYPPTGQARGVPITTQSIKSALALPWPATLSAEPHLLHGFAHSPHEISSVQWSIDKRGWREAKLQRTNSRHSWTRFEFRWSPKPGDYTITTRATDKAGNTQPPTMPFNEKGYLFNQPLPHPVQVRTQAKT